jgi:hypothetical protein
MRKVTRTQVLWIASAASLTVAAAVAGCGSSSSGGNTAEDGGLSSSSSGAGSSGAGSSGTGSSGAGSSGVGSSSGASSGGISDASTDAKADGAVASDGSTTDSASDAGLDDDVSTSDASCTTLNVYNFDSWCSVSVNGGTSKTDGVQTVCVTPGSIPLVTSPKNATFELGQDPWVYISGAGGTDSGISGAIVGDGGVGSTSTTSVDVGTTTGCVEVCCPFSSNGTGCTSAFTGYTTFTANCP